MLAVGARRLSSSLDRVMRPSESGAAHAVASEPSGPRSGHCLHQGGGAARCHAARGAGCPRSHLPSCMYHRPRSGHCLHQGGGAARCLAARGAGCPRSLLSHRMCTIRADGGASSRYFVYRTPLHHLHLLRPRARHALAAEGSTRGATALFFFLPPTIPLEHLIFCLPSVHPSACVVISCVWVSSRVS